ncbi:hypothetical protein BH20ACT22_BH20ACT22_20260 [soil metagenome]
MFKTILLAVDGSEHSDKAGDAVRDIARQYGWGCFSSVTVRSHPRVRFS